MSKKYTLVVVPETHWDREWYLTFEEFRIRLVRLTDKLLSILDTDPEFKSFTFDGQTVVIEDYLEIRPQERERIRKHIQSGRLLIGPWYVLPDEFLVSGEALIRNLMIGHKIGEEFGRTMKAGYIPDPFGHISQLPQILAGFGIWNVYFTRGLGDEADTMHSEFWWQAPDGTKVLAINQVNSYCNGVNLGVEYLPDKGRTVNLEIALRQAKEQVESLAKKAATKYLLLNNGCDHVEPQPELPQIIRYLNEHLEDTEVIHSTYEEYAELVLREKPALKTYCGELHNGKYHPLLSGVFSARMYLKQANERTQTLLEKWAEPTCAFAWLNGSQYDSQLLWHAWKYLIKCHPHDSICGCSIDQVHREMMPRFQQAQQIGETLTSESLRYLAEHVDTRTKNFDKDTQAMVVFNPHSWEVTDTVTVHVEKELSPGEMAPSYVVKDENGSPVATHVTNDYIMETGRRRAKWSADVHFTGENIPPLGYKTYYLQLGEATVDSPLKVGLGYLENDFLKVNVRSNGTFDLFHKQTRTTYHNLNLLEDTEDCGDEYDYGWAYNSRTVTSEGIGGTLSIIERGPGIGVLRCDFVMQLPESLTADRMSRAEKTVACPVIVYVKVHAGLPRVDVITVFENNARDHRLRAHFPTGFPADFCYAEGQFGVVRRSLEVPPGKGWVQRPVGQKPVQSYVAVDGTDCGIAVINQGLPEYEVIKGEQCVIAQTLLRCCGWLSRDDFQARPYNAGPAIPTPDAQCLGKHIFRYAVLPYQGSWKRSMVWRQAHQHNAPPRAVVTGIHKGELPKSLAFVSVSPSNVIVTAVKKAEKCEGLIVRVLNTTGDPVEAALTLYRKFKGVILTNLNEEPLEIRPTVNGNTVRFPMPAFRVQTVLFKF
ncbi:MAG: glycoside hydrolase family 38 C-terminal domain-containing protein [Armatimonadota bacterium]|nr:glycoside hydrolase family 38 C-terminal domain-containing protein [Armatimonadota bacterium]